MKTTYPKEPIKDFNEWRKFISEKAITPEEKFEANFMRIWSEFKTSINKARTK
tara:strand:- start:5574 stop:5732 length:159 start_codon:yes stop_codon:yes gene_type:complete